MSSRRIQAMAKLIGDIEFVTRSYTDYHGFYQMTEAIRDKIKAYRKEFQAPKDQGEG